MNKNMTEMHRLCGELPPAAMPTDMRCRLLAAMERESTELQADAEFEAELLEQLRPASAPVLMRQRMLQQMAGGHSRRRLLWRSSVAAVAMLLATMPILWWAPWSEPQVAAGTVELQRRRLPTAAGAPATRQDTFVMRGADNSRLVIRVKATVDSQLPEEVI